jgi:hypothetical protein
MLRRLLEQIINHWFPIGPGRQERVAAPCSQAANPAGNVVAIEGRLSHTRLAKAVLG